MNIKRVILISLCSAAVVALTYCVWIFLRPNYDQPAAGWSRKTLLECIKTAEKHRGYSDANSYVRTYLELLPDSPVPKLEIYMLVFDLHVSRNGAEEEFVDLRFHAVGNTSVLLEVIALYLPPDQAACAECQVTHSSDAVQAYKLPARSEFTFLDGQWRLSLSRLETWIAEALAKGKGIEIRFADRALVLPSFDWSQVSQLLKAQLIEARTRLADSKTAIGTRSVRVHYEHLPGKGNRH